jgi:GDP-4-dehydro-6-deoxy-D-mannose reductase
MPGFAAPAFARQIARIRLGLDAPLLRVGNLAAVRDFLDVRDVVRAYRLLAESGFAGDFDIVNVSSGTGRRMSDLVEGLADLAGVAVSVEIDPGLFRPVDVAFSVGDPGKLAARTGFAPGVPWDRTLSDLLTEWMTREGGLVQGQNA